MTATVRVFVYSGQFQDRLIGLKNRIENTPPPQLWVRRTDCGQIIAYRRLVASLANGLHVPVAMFTHNGRIAVYERDPKSGRAKSRKQKPLQAVQTIIAIIEGVKSPAELRREKRRKRLLGRSRAGTASSAL
jgi:hypothetical protein